MTGLGYIEKNKKQKKQEEVQKKRRDYAREYYRRNKERLREVQKKRAKEKRIRIGRNPNGGRHPKGNGMVELVKEGILTNAHKDFFEKNDIVPDKRETKDKGEKRVYSDKEYDIIKKTIQENVIDPTSSWARKKYDIYKIKRELHAKLKGD